MRKKYRQSQDAIDSANRNASRRYGRSGVLFLIAKVLNRTLPETPSSSSVSGVLPCREPTWTISHKKGHFEIKCTNKPSFTYSLSACGNMGIFDNRGYYRVIFSALITAAVPGISTAQEAYPQKPILALIAYPAGGGTDVAARHSENG